MKKILIGTKNTHKREKLSKIIAGRFEPVYADALPEVEETGTTFLEVAEAKAAAYSLMKGGMTIATDGGAVLPGLISWDPLRTRRFLDGTDEERIAKLMDLMKNAADRTIEWHEAIAVAESGRVLFSAEARAMDGKIANAFERRHYRPGIWLCSITDFPTFGGRNFFDLSPQEQAATEDSWTELGRSFNEFADGLK